MGIHLRLGALATLVLGIALPLQAQTLDELDRLSAASDKPATGLALARSQADNGALLEALATLERVLAAKPDDKSAKLLHAAILCRIDDGAGADAEFARLKAKDFKKPAWAEALAACGKGA